MTPERWRKIEEVFQAALDLPEVDRRWYINEACEGDEELRDEVLALVEQHEEAGDFIEAPAVAASGLLPASDPGVDSGFDPHATNPSTSSLVDPAIGRRVGAYRIVREIGRGGMGAVYEASRADSEFRMRVAVKLIKRGMDTDFILRRFRNERQILAALDHPNIARLLDGGTTSDGLPFFVMEYIEGQPAYRYCDERKLTVQERLRLFLQVCDAVEYAHKNLVIHRDIKPSNIIVTPAGVPKLLDFGIAKVLNPDIAGEITHDPTATAMRLMTPEYASPEQVHGQAVTPASDVYSLGVLLYELLTGHRPYRLRNRSAHEVARVICEEEPPPPSAVISRPEDLLPANPPSGDHATLEYLYWSRGSTVESLRRELSGDLDNIIMKALRKESERRYQSAGELREDIARHLEGRPVSAQPFFPSVINLPPLPPREPTGNDRAIAVLPLKLIDARRAGETGDDYLGVGLADALITRLSQLRRFPVRPTSSVLRYQSADADPFEAGRSLDAAFVLDGRIRRAGDSIRVTVQLLDVRAAATVWAGQFDEKFTDVLMLEDAITGQVAESVVPHLTGDERRRLQKRGTESHEAFEAYLRGRFHWNTFTEEGFAKAIVFYQQAIAHDPSYAVAYAGVAEYYNWLGIYGVLPFRECAAAAYDAAARAVSLDPALAEGHAALGQAALCRDFDWSGGEASLRRAIDIDPHYAAAHLWYSFQLTMEGRFDEAVREGRRAVELDPLTVLTRYNLGWLHYHARLYEEGIAHCRSLMEDEPANPMNFACLSSLLTRTGRHEEAEAAARKAAELGGPTAHALGRLACALAAGAKTQEAEEVLRRMEETAASRYVSPYHIALAHCALGRAERALDFLEEAFEQGDAWLLWMGVEPQLDALRREPRFEVILRNTHNPGAMTLRPGVLRRPAESGTGERSVAVLPLRVAGDTGAGNTGESGDDYLGVGLTDALITRLSSVARFTVRPTSSVLRYRGEGVDPLRAGRELGVDFVVDGSVKRAGERIRVNAQLFDVREGVPNWAGHFDESSADVLGLEDSIAEQVAGALLPRLTGDERRRLQKRGTDSPEAYEAYLRGRYHWNTFTEEGFARALVHFNRAVALAPDYALAYAGIADYYNWLGVYAVMPFAETSAAAKEAGLKAVTLDPALAEGYSALGFATLMHDFDWDGAGSLLRRAVELNPNYATGRLWYGYFLGLAGRFDEALAHTRRALELDPLTPIVHHTLNWTYYHSRRYEESVASARRLVANEPRYGLGHLFLSLLLWHTGRHDEAIESGRRAVELLGRTPYTLTWLASAYAAAGRKEQARELLSEIEAMSSKRYVSPYLLATVYRNLGEHERAFAELERAWTIRDARLAWLGVDPQFDALRGDPRLAELLRRTNNPNAPARSRPAIAPSVARKLPSERATTGEPRTGEKSIAVLPLKLLNPVGDGNSGDAFLGFGLADALITCLSNVRRFLVRPTSSVLQYGDSRVDPFAAGHELGVDFVLDGHIQKSADEIRISVQLLDVTGRTTFWAAAFDEKFTDVLGLQDTIATKVAEALVPRLTGDERRRLQKRGTDSPEAYEAYLRGRYHWNSMSEDGFAKAIACFERAVSLDPSFAAAYAGVADYHCWLAVYGLNPPDEALASAREAAERAVELDDTLADAHTAYGLSLIRHATQWDEAGARFRRAIELNPNYAPARAHYACQLAMQGRFDESLSEARRACEVDPLNPFTAYFLAWCLYQSRRYEECVEQAHLLLRTEPRYGSARFVLAWAMRALGRRQEAISEAEKSIELLGDIPMFRAGLAAAYADAGRETDARRVLASLDEQAAERFVTPYHRALVRAALGEREHALELLEEGCERFDPWLVWLAVEPQLDGLRKEPRFESLLRKTGNPSAKARDAKPKPKPAGGRPTDDEEAYQLYVAGHYFATRRTAEGLRQGIERLERAVKRDPGFALAWAELADCYSLLNWYVEPPPVGAWERARQVATKAVEADATLAEARASLGLVKLYYERDWGGAEAELRRAVELNPDNALARRWHAFNLSAMGRHDEALVEIERTRELAPISPVAANAVANVLFFARRYDDTIAQCRKALELDPGSVPTHIVMRWAYEMKGMCDEAFDVYEQERAFAGDTPTTRCKRAHVLAACGREDEARAILDDLVARRADQWVTAYEIAVVHSLLGDRDGAFRWLEQAEQEHAVGLAFVRVDPRLDALRGDTRFDALLRRAGTGA